MHSNYKICNCYTNIPYHTIPPDKLHNIISLENFCILVLPRFRFKSIFNELYKIISISENRVSKSLEY